MAIRGIGWSSGRGELGNDLQRGAFAGLDSPTNLLRRINHGNPLDTVPTKRRAAAKPEMPPPTTTTSKLSTATPSALTRHSTVAGLSHPPSHDMGRIQTKLQHQVRHDIVLSGRTLTASEPQVPWRPYHPNSVKSLDACPD
jgi:hypothetical protein